MRLFTLLIAATAIVSFAGTASAGVEPIDLHSECVENFNATWGAPGENVGPGERANDDARTRNDERKAACDHLKIDDEVDPD
jgi:hypothetical protein